MVLVGISILWIPLIKAAQQGQLFLYIQALTGYIAPPICSVFLLAVFVPRVTEKVLNLHKLLSFHNTSSPYRTPLKFAFYITLLGSVLGHDGGAGEWIDKDGPGLRVSLPWLWATRPSSSCSCQSPFYLLFRVAPDFNSFGCGFHQSSRKTSKKQIGEFVGFFYIRVKFLKRHSFNTPYLIKHFIILTGF